MVAVTQLYKPTKNYSIYSYNGRLYWYGNHTSMKLEKKEKILQVKVGTDHLLSTGDVKDGVSSGIKDGSLKGLYNE